MKPSPIVGFASPFGGAITPVPRTVAMQSVQKQQTVRPKNRTKQ
jgi:hypothetical protein